MEKLSSILPGNPRVRTVDLGEARPARPGTPSYGREVGKTASEREKITISAAARDSLLREIQDVVSPKIDTVKAQEIEMPQASQAPAINENLAELSGTTLDKYA